MNDSDMADTLAKEKDANGPTVDEVITFLKENPKFIKEHPEALEFLIPPKERPKKGEVADFQSYMIERLRDEKEKALTTSREIVETSRANLNNQQRVHDAILRLLESNSFDDFVHCITMDLASLLSVDIAVLVVESDDHKVPHINTSGVRIIPPGTVDKWMQGENVRLQDNISGIEQIYGGGATLVRSQILLRVDISMDTPPAILAFGSRDPDMFQEGQATDQVSFLARVIERCFRSWLKLPA